MATIPGRKSMEILVFGAGAVGGILGWRIAQNLGVRVSVVCRSNYQEVKSHGGFKMRTATWGDGTFKPYRIIQNLYDAQAINFDYVICAHKAYAHDQAILPRMLRDVVRLETTLVTAQNGLGIEAALRNAFPRNTVLSSVCYVSCQQSRPGFVEQGAQIRTHAFHIGRWKSMYTDHRADEEKLQQLVDLDPMFKAVHDMDVEQWTKLIFNGSWNPISALTGHDTHQILHAESGKPLLMVTRLAEEIYEVAKRSGTLLPPDLPAKTIDFALAAAPIIPSMLQDVRRHRLMEIEPVCGESKAYPLAKTSP